MRPEFPDEDIMTLLEVNVEDEDRDKWIVWFDGASNALGHRVGAVSNSPAEQYIPFTARFGFDCTNNIGEYAACAPGIQVAIDFKVKLLKVYEDLALVIHQLKGEWETRDHKLVPYQAYMVLLQCVDAREAEQMLVEVHEGSFGTHANGHVVAWKILRAGYY